MLIVCGQCRFRFEAEADGQASLVCPRCGRMIAAPSAKEEQLVSEGEGGGEEVVEAEEEGFAEAARQTAGRKVTVVCGSCGKSLKVSARLAGKARRCPGCKEKILIPYPEDDEDAAFLKRAGLAEGEELDLVRGPSSSRTTRGEDAGQEVAEGEGAAAGGAGPGHAYRAAESWRGAVPGHRRAHPRAPGGPVRNDSAAEAIAAAVGPGEIAGPPVGTPVAAGPSFHAIDASLAEAAKQASAAPATADQDAARRRRLVTGAAAMILGLFLAVGGILVSYYLFIRPAPSGDETSGRSDSPQKGAPLDGATNAAIDPAANGATRLAPGRSTEPSSGGSTTPKVAVKPSIFTVPVLETPRAPQPPPGPAEPTCAVGEAFVDLFLADGYCPASPGRAYWKVEIDVTAGPRQFVLNPFLPRAGLSWPEGNAPCAGLLEPGAWPSQRVVRHPVSLAPNQSAKRELLFDVPQGVQEAVLHVEGLSDMTVRPTIGPSGPGGTLWPGTYAESPPRNLQPLLKDPVMASIQSSPRLELTVARDSEGFRLSLADASVTGTASPAGPGAYAVRLQKGIASLDGKLLAASGGRLLILYLQDAPFHQITFARQGAPAP